MVKMNESINLMQDGLDEHGDPLPYGRCAVDRYRGDLPERSSVTGMKTHDGSIPCMKCYARKDELHTKYKVWSLTNSPWMKRIHATW